MKKKTDWLLAIVCSEIIVAGVLAVSMLSYYFWKLFI